MKYRLNETLVEIFSIEEYKSRSCNSKGERSLLESLDYIRNCRAEQLKDSIVGTFAIPSKENPLKETAVFGYFIDKTKLIFVDDSRTAEKLLKEISAAHTGEQLSPTYVFLEFLEHLLRHDGKMLQGYEAKLTAIEEDLLIQESNFNFNRVILNHRKELLRMNSYYGELVEMGECLTANYNGMITEEELDMFRLFCSRTGRLYNTTQVLREYTLQLRELYQSQIELRQNKIMKVLTVVTTIFMPLTLVTGWYGMNFKHMPELVMEYGYKLVTATILIILLLELLFLKWKNWFK